MKVKHGQRLVEEKLTKAFNVSRQAMGSIENGAESFLHNLHFKRGCLISSDNYQLT
jgi:DNA-binding XRE family transcriptional regulator